VALGGWWRPEEAAEPVTSRAIGSSCRGGSGVEEPTAKEAAAAEEVTAAWRSRPRRAEVGSDVEELREAPAAEEATAWRSRPRWAAVGPGLLVEAGGWVPALDDGVAAAMIDLSEWAWTRGRAGRAG
jgi:hypothetical protein